MNTSARAFLLVIIITFSASVVSFDGTHELDLQSERMEQFGEGVTGRAMQFDNIRGYFHLQSSSF